MRVALGILCILFGGIGWIGQIISGFNYPWATRHGLQEAMEGTDPVFRRAEMNAARWDIFVLWTLMAAGILMVANNSWWPYLALISGGIYIDGAGREIAKSVSLKEEGVRIGTPKDLKIAGAFFTIMFVAAFCVIAAGIYVLAR